jgi:hypothetical protein
VSRRNVVTEITIETNQVLVIKRRQVSRLWYGECGSEAEFVRVKVASAQMDETGNQPALEALFGSPQLTNAVDGFQVIGARSLLGAATLGQRRSPSDSSTVSDAVANRKARPRE